MGFLSSIVGKVAGALFESIRGFFGDRQAREDQKSLGRLEGANTAHEEVQDAKDREDAVREPSRDDTVKRLRNHGF